MTERKYFVETYGCQMNVNDSEKAAGLLEADGMVRSETPDGADVIFVNTCAVRERAAEKLYHAVGRYRTLKKENTAKQQSTIVYTSLYIMKYTIF